MIIHYGIIHVIVILSCMDIPCSFIRLYHLFMLCYHTLHTCISSQARGLVGSCAFPTCSYFKAGLEENPPLIDSYFNDQAELQ